MRTISTTTLPDTVTKGLSCAALYPTLRSILVFDAPYPALEWITATLAEMLIASGSTVKQVRIGVSEQEDDLWGSLVLRQAAQGTPVVWHQGLLAGKETETRVRQVCIPDLASLSLTTMRACVTLMGAEIANLERHGQHRQWRPNFCWVAGCASSAVGSISPHLLDRFVLRLNWRGPTLQKSPAELLQEVRAGTLAEAQVSSTLAPEIKEQLTQVAQRWVEPTAGAYERVLFHMAAARSYTPRREIALARLALALAQLDQKANEVTATHVDEAAQLIDLMAPPQRTASPSSPSIDPSSTPSPPSDSATTTDASSSSSTTGSNQSDISTETEPISVAGTTAVSSDTSLTVELSPYPEDKAQVQREATSLRLPFFQYPRARMGRGPIVGVEQAGTLRDLAVVSTLFAAAPFQPIRHLYRRDDSRSFILYPTDLRSYRRAPTAKHLLLLLLDYTSLRDCNWQKALLPYLRKAYVERASISIVQVGATHATDELRAEVVSARSVLVPSITAALEGTQGKATPLAHGLDLAIRTLRHALQHGRSTVQEALFVLVSDGRGNVPIEVSRSGCLAQSVNRQGVEDTLQIAKLLHSLKGVRAILLNPQPKHYPDLPLNLAEALGAEVVNIPPRKEV